MAQFTALPKHPQTLRVPSASDTLVSGNTTETANDPLMKSRIFFFKYILMDTLPRHKTQL